MPVYSHSRLSTYEECPWKYKLRYLDGIERYEESVEAFLGHAVHETLKKAYDDARFPRVNTIDNVLAYYERYWRQHWHEGVAVSRPELTPEDYLARGRGLIESYYQRHAPFDADVTLGTEVPVVFSLDDSGRYRLRGFIDRLSRTANGAYQVHDYKTSARLPTQQEADGDRQLALYQVGVQRMWPHVKDVTLVWHYLAFDQDIVSSRSEEAISQLVTDTARLIDGIESAEEFPPRESALCDWCEYPDLCPQRKHLCLVESLPQSEYLNEPGVVLVNRYAELRQQASGVEAEMTRVKEAIVDYARREGVGVITGSTHKARVKFDERLKFPGKSDEEREELDRAIVEAGRWMEVSQLDTTALARVVERGLWDRELTDRVMQYRRVEETASVYLSKLREGE